jgi:hypothetical protein
MTKLLERAMAELSRLPEAEQDALAEWLLAEIDAERRWQTRFADSTDRLAELAAEALAEHRSGQTRKLDPESL